MLTKRGAENIVNFYDGIDDWKSVAIVKYKWQSVGKYSKQLIPMEWQIQNLNW